MYLASLKQPPFRAISYGVRNCLSSVPWKSLGFKPFGNEIHLIKCSVEEGRCLVLWVIAQARARQAGLK